MTRTRMHQAAQGDAAGGPAGHPRLPPGPETACDSYAPGHLMHYTHQGRALRSAGLPAAEVWVRGTAVTVTLPDGEVLRWHHHNPARLTRLLDLVLGPRMVYVEQHALRVGPYWFNCADERSWSDCG